MNNSPKKSLLVFFIIASLGMGMLPLINIIKKPNEISQTALYNTDVIESYYNFFIYKTLNKSTNPANVIAGKNGDLFLGNKHNKLIYKTLGEYPFSESQIQNWSNNVWHLQQWFENQGIQFILVVAPNKHSIYGENLPRWVIPAKPNLTDRLVDAGKQLGANILDLRPIFLNQKPVQEERLYWKTDSHWNELGASIAFTETIKTLNAFYQQNIILPTYRFNIIITKPNGGHSNFLKIQELLPEDYETWMYRVIEDDNEVCTAKIDPDSFEPGQCEMELRPYLDIHQGPVYTVNEHALNHKSALILADSFLMQNSNLYNKTFNKTWKHKYNYLMDESLQKFIDIHKPDVVIYQIVERSLFNNRFIDIRNTQKN